MSEKLHFKVSAGLKNIIGKELINDKFIAIFELVKNSYDAGAKEVTIKFENIYSDNSTIYIIDDGKGMSKQEIIDKWLFVAYSEKKNNTYRDNIKFRRNYAGAKGVGRFSCDRLGETVELLSKTNKDIKVNRVKINWNEFENVDTEEFQNIEVLYDEMRSSLISDQGTVIKIYGLREKWNRDELLQLKKSLTQLVNPEANENYDMFSVILDVEEEKENDRKKSENEKVFDKDIVNGKVINHVFDVLNIKTTKITAAISKDGKKITTTLNDRGIQLFEIQEKNKYGIKNIKGTIYSLNRAAKINFTKMMGIESVNYGSVFIYKNGFRVYPYGEPEKDFMNIDRRKAQGYNRYLGTREICGRIDIFGDNKGFVETSSRNNGFISSYETEELEDFFYEYLLKPLEKYVVNIIHWGEEVIDSESLARNGNFLNDILFYSSHGFDIINQVMKREGLEGVFLADRNNGEFIEKVQLLIDKAIRRAENLINIRGIVMDTTSGFDNKIRDLVSIMWPVLGDKEAEIANNIKKKILKDNIKTAERLDKKYPNINANNIDDLLNERDFSAIRQARLLSWCIESNEMIKRKFQEILKKYLYMSNGEVHDKFFELYKNDIVLYRNALAHIKNTPSIDSKVIIGEVDGKAVQFDQQLCDALRKKLLSYENILDEMYMFIESNF
ncbi:ATP-binding protein [Coprococcus eutactus]|uniref:ATP-binding protein n=1 Tax=Coprococcus eutactus TaxID=33043 RepID=UPI001D0675C5|nr:ATP-binding protein [Coprococcus eutactus]MCB6629684.1 ATP-binding protein [Coprococcus eutactus]MCG4790863.1 ATP-binding protein [Coprococcus eutactus]MCQ5119573.1 ATP-binding protein [Coprococcus eutactus]MCQ5133338.1 ATP-binding protein [Coprococcus eutactus]MCQ5136487.1 ATP-binding protein [Coprococcus eutactus]